MKRQCGSCQQWWDVDEMASAKRCIRCKEYHRQWSARNKDRILEYQQARRKADPNGYREASKRSYEKNRETILAKRVEKRDEARQYARDYYAANKQRRIEQNKQWRQKNPERARDQSRRKAQRRRARLRELAVEDFSTADLVAYWIEFGIDPESCFYCGGPYEHDDHVVPLSRGGTHERANLVPACARCNRSKHDKLLHEWRPERFAA